MIVSHKRRFVYIGPPRTASTSLHFWLTQPTLCESLWIGGEQHSSAVPPEALDYFTFATVREPLDRAVSLWRHYEEHQAEKLGFGSLDFAGFIALLPDMPWLYRTIQAKILLGVRLDAVVRFHRLVEDLRALPFIGETLPLLEPLARLNQSEQPGRLSECYTPELEAEVRNWWADDVALWAVVNATRCGSVA